MPGLVLSYEAALGILHTAKCDDQVVDIRIGTFLDERIMVIVRTKFENSNAFTGYLLDGGVYAVKYHRANIVSCFGGIFVVIKRRCLSYYCPFKDSFRCVKCLKP